MKRFGIILITAVTMTVILATSYHGARDYGMNGPAVQDTLVKYQDGTFEGQSRHRYTDEPYWGKVRVTIANGLFTDINFVIRDSNLHETFNGSYEKHFEGNAVYVQQCRNDWNGVMTYPGKLLEVQDINKVDGTSGATWSYKSSGVT